MSALLGHADAARCMAEAYRNQAEALRAEMRRAQAIETLAALSAAYMTTSALAKAHELGATLMLEENRRQIEAPRETPPTR